MVSGWTPFKEEMLTYQDALILQVQADRWGRERESLPTIRIYLSEFLDAKKATVIAHSYQTYRSKLRILQNGLNIRSWMTFILVASRENIFATSCNTWWNIIRYQNERF